MKLDLTQINSVAQGAADVVGEDGVIRFSRFGAAERELYLKHRFYNKTFTTSGVKLEFTTDGDSFNVSAVFTNPTSRNYFAFEVFANGRRAGVLKNFEDGENGGYTHDECALGELTGRFPLGSGDKKVTVYFPWSVECQLRSAEVENATYITPVKRAKKLLAYGDSITHGYDARYPSDTYIERIARELDAEVFNKGIGGEVFFPELAQIKAPFTPDLITVAYGTNDWSTKEQPEFCENCKRFYSALAENYPDTPVYAVTPIWRIDCEGSTRFGKFPEVEEQIRGICAPYGNITVVTGFDLVPHDVYFYADRKVHPNDEGFARYAENLLKYIK